MAVTLVAQEKLLYKDSRKPRTISKRLSELTQKTFVGREEELSLISDTIRSSYPPFMVVFIHGPGGIGKSRLIRSTLDSVASEVQTILMDCREIEPTPKGFLRTLGDVLGLGKNETSLNSVVDRLGWGGQRTVLALDTYETFGLMDTWLRQVFVPALSQSVFTIIAGRQAPSAAWLTSPGWQELFREVKLGELSSDDSRKMLESRGLTSIQVERVRNFARGYPIVLEIAAVAIRTQPDLKIEDGPPPKVLQQLTHVFLSGLTSKLLEAVEATSTVRRITEPLLRALLMDPNTREVFKDLQELPFIDVTTEGLIFHDVVRETISMDLSWRDFERYQLYRKRAWHYFSKESSRAVARRLWQYTAEMLYMIENPIVKDAFFPKGAADIIVEPATSNDGSDIFRIVKEVEPQESGRFINLWWQRHPETFNVARTQEGKTVAFYNLFQPGNVDQTLLKEDPLTSLWLKHLGENPVAPGERILFCRRWLDQTAGEIPSPAISACFLDIKRTYMELRPTLRRIYGTVRDLAVFEPILFPLGFKSLENSEVLIDDTIYYTLMNDFGPASVDGWLQTRVGAELGLDSSWGENKTVDGHRQLVTVLFTDIVKSTEKATELGDRLWSDLLARHHSLVRKLLASFKGREIDTAGDGFFATFERPTQAIKCACAIQGEVETLGIQIRAGLHLGECEVIDDAVRGITVHIGARIAVRAEAGEVLVSSTLRNAVVGSDLQFKNCGFYKLKGIPGEWNLFAAKRDP